MTQTFLQERRSTMATYAVEFASVMQSSPVPQLSAHSLVVLVIVSYHGNRRQVKKLLLCGTHCPRNGIECGCVPELWCRAVCTVISDIGAFYVEHHTINSYAEPDFDINSEIEELLLPISYLPSC